jgi:eukaryotic-like serine/threonine-protein kinase
MVMPSPAWLISDRYEIQEPLGRGGMGTVHRGWDRVLARPVAVKVLPFALSADEGAASRLRREARAAARLNHPGIVAVFDAGVADGVPYLVMEHVEGHTLAEELRQGPIPSDRAATIAASIAAALSVAHAAGVVHRDVKPANVLLTPSGEIKVTDFGIARAVDDDTVTPPSSVVGSAPYLSPEQVRGEAGDARSDLYALGVVLFQMLTGRLPFEADTAVAMAFKHLEEQPRPPTEVEPEIPEALDAVALRALAKDPADRFGSADELVAALLPFVKEPEASAMAPTAPPIRTPDEDTGELVEAPAEAPARRPRWALLVALALLAVATWTVVMAVRSPEPAPAVDDPRRSTPNGVQRTEGSTTGGGPTEQPPSDPEPDDAPEPDQQQDGTGEPGSSGSTPPPSPTEPPSPQPTSPEPSPSSPAPTPSPPPSPGTESALDQG